MNFRNYSTTRTASLTLLSHTSTTSSKWLRKTSSDHFQSFASPLLLRKWASKKRKSSLTLAGLTCSLSMSFSCSWSSMMQLTSSPSKFLSRTLLFRRYSSLQLLCALAFTVYLSSFAHLLLHLLIFCTSSSNCSTLRSQEKESTLRTFFIVSMPR